MTEEKGHRSRRFPGSAEAPEHGPGEHGGVGPLVAPLGSLGVEDGQAQARPCWAWVRPGSPGKTEDRCPESAALEVYGIPLCEAHGAESAAGLAEELYGDAADYLARPDNPSVRPMDNRATAWACREAASMLEGRENAASYAGDEALARAWPFSEELTDPETLAYPWARDSFAPERDSGPPEEWYRGPRLLLHKLMRLAHEDGATAIVEMLEREREATAAQLAYALADAARKGHGYSRLSPA